MGKGLTHGEEKRLTHGEGVNQWRRPMEKGLTNGEVTNGEGVNQWRRG